jgi:hypothetical protein
MRNSRYALIAMVLLVASSLVAAQAGDRLAQGIKAHDDALAGDEASVGEALRLLGPEGWERPPLALAYHGSAFTLEASLQKKAGKLMKALTRIDDGTKEMDSALALEPGNIRIRLLRMENSIALVEESPVDRRPQLVEDIASLRNRWEELKPEEKALVELDSGRLALADRRLGEANAFWRKAVREAPGSKADARAKKLLARYGD